MKKTLLLAGSIAMACLLAGWPNPVRGPRRVRSRSRVAFLITPCPPTFYLVEKHYSGAEAERRAAQDRKKGLTRLCWPLLDTSGYSSQIQQKIHRHVNFRRRSFCVRQLHRRGQLRVGLDRACRPKATSTPSS